MQRAVDAARQVPDTVRVPVTETAASSRNVQDVSCRQSHAATSLLMGVKLGRGVKLGVKQGRS